MSASPAFSARSTRSILSAGPMWRWSWREWTAPLPTVVAGLVPCPVVAVPTSVGYGASFEGLAPLLTMLTACAPGIAVVNIDNGFGAAALTHRILSTSIASP